MTTISISSSPKVSFCSYCRKKIAANTDLLESFSYMAMNIAILAGKIFEQFPQIIANTARTLLSFLGVISLNLSIEQLVKSAKDIKKAFIVHDINAVLLGALKVVVIFINIVLTCAHVVAACMFLSGSPQLAFALYMILRPFALVALVTDVVLEALSYAENHIVLKKIRKIVNLNEKRELVENLCHTIKSNNVTKFSVKVLRQIKTYSLKELKKEIPNQINLTDERIIVLFSQIQKIIEMNEKMYKADIGLKALGYTSMFFCRLYPESILDKSLVLGMNVLYTARLIYQKFDLQGKISRTASRIHQKLNNYFERKISRSVSCGTSISNGR